MLLPVWCYAGMGASAMAQCLSVTSQSSIKSDERINVVFGIEASFDQSYTAFYANLGIYKNKGTSLWNFPELRT